LAAGDRLPFTIVQANLDSKKGNGTILFDHDRGRVDRSDMSLELQGQLTVAIGGQNTTVELHQEQKTVVQLTDHDPLKM
jgi:hypothetical protein